MDTYVSVKMLLNADFKKVGCSPREGECFLDIPHPEREMPTGKSQSENLLTG
jgi:hypothetical protein